MRSPTLRMTRRGALSQQLNAVESLASADTVCIDKTGTLTEDRLRVVDLIPADDADEGELSVLLGRYAASSPSRNSLEAVAAAYPDGGARARGRAVLVAAPLERPVDGRALVRAGRARALRPRGPPRGARRGGAAGRRVLAFAVGGAQRRGPDSPPPPVRPLGLVVLAEAAPRRARPWRSCSSRGSRSG